MTALPVFDGHNDVLLRLCGLASGIDPVRAFLDGRAGGHLDLPRARTGGFAGGLFAVFVPSDPGDMPADPNALMGKPAYDVPLPPPLAREHAWRATAAMLDLLDRIAAASAGAVRVCGSAAAIRQAMADGALAAVPHLEGAEAIDEPLEALDALVARGVRSIGPVWSRPNAFGDGVPFRFPATPDTGAGLTPTGERLVRECHRRRILIDVSHMTERAFRDVARIGVAPLVASHSNAHALCPHSRNLTDDQLAIIRDSRGLVGVNFATTFLRADGRLDADTAIGRIVDHLAHLLDRLGEDGVGLGSDFDGATIPAQLGDVAGLPRLLEAMRARGFGEPLVAKVAQENWLRVLERTWGA